MASNQNVCHIFLHEYSKDRVVLLQVIFKEKYYFVLWRLMQKQLNFNVYHLFLHESSIGNRKVILLLSHF